MTLRRSPLLTAKLTQRADDLRAQGCSREADLITAKLAKRPKRMKPRRERHDVAATGERRKALALTQHGDETGAYCASPWCGRQWRPLDGSLFERIHEAHADNVGMGRSRHAQGAEVNREENRALLCFACHDRLAKVQGAARRLELFREWKELMAFRPGHGARRGR